MKWGLRNKLILAMSMSALIPVTFTNVFTAIRGTEAIEHEEFSKLVAVKEMKKDAVTKYFELIEGQVLTFSDDVMVRDAMVQFSKAFDEYIYDNNFGPLDFQRQKAAVKKYYSDEFGAKYNTEVGKSIDTDSLVGGLSEQVIALQDAYIASNPNPLGSKETLDRAPDYSSYSSLHEKYHPSIRGYLQKFGYYDIFLVDIESGDIVYSVFKELDFATSLLTGPYSKTNFADAFRAAKQITKKDTAVLVDYARYTPSYEAPASFIATPIWEGGEKIGVAIFQMPVDRINEFMAAREGLGETSESFIVGPDQLMRSDSHLDPERHSVAASFKNPAKGKVEMEFLQKALNGESGTEMETDYRGVETLIAYSPIKILGQHDWAVVSKIDKEEAFAAADALNWANTVLLIVGNIIILFVSVLFSRSIAGNIRDKADRLRRTANSVRSSSKDVAQSGADLSSASATQASSLQETVASVDEISSMVQYNADSAKNSTAESQRSTEAAREGKRTVETMIDSIGEIEKNNDEIMTEMQKNYKEMEQISEVIKEIGSKTKVINDIVFQTKLLSFNASVEAARAGEHGKGFAVVAHEVGNLASMSGKAADEITEMLDNSTKQVSDIVDRTRKKVDSLLKTAKDKVSLGTKTANECGVVLDEILEHANLVNKITQEIASASTEQATGIKEITTAIQQIDQSAHKNKAVAQQTLDNADQLKRQSDEMQGAVEDLFKILDGRQVYGPSNADSEPGKKSPSVSPSSGANPSGDAGSQRNVFSINSQPAASQPNSSAVSSQKSQPAGRSSASTQMVTHSQEVPSADDDRFVDL